jgi:hypothetical protein
VCKAAALQSYGVGLGVQSADVSALPGPLPQSSVSPAS